MKLRIFAISAAFLVTLLWSSSYFLNVIAFNEGVGPMTLAGLRYTVAAVVLFILTLRKKNNYQLKNKLSLKQTMLLGLTGYIVAQGFQYSGQYFLTPTQTSLLLNIGNTTIVALIASLFIQERIKPLTMLGMIGVSIGALLYYFPWSFGVKDITGIFLVLLSSIGYAVHLTWTRHLLVGGNIQATELVMKPMAIGAAGMIITGVALEGIPQMSWSVVFIVLWLGIINGSLAFSLWTWSQRHLEAFESSLINNLMLIEIALFDMVYLQRSFTILETTGLILVVLTILAVQILPIYKKR